MIWRSSSRRRGDDWPSRKLHQSNSRTAVNFRIGEDPTQTPEAPRTRDPDFRVRLSLIHRLKGSHSGHHHRMREEGRALRAWLKVRESYLGPIFLSKQKRPIDRTTLHLLMKNYGAAAGIRIVVEWSHGDTGTGAPGAARGGKARRDILAVGRGRRCKSRGRGEEL